MVMNQKVMGTFRAIQIFILVALPTVATTNQAKQEKCSE